MQPNEHSSFALELAAYLRHLLKAGGLSGRELSRRAATGGHAHWADVVSGAKVMTTNDVKVAAEVFDLDPYDFVARARGFGGSVSGLPEDIPVLPRADERQLREEIAAMRGDDESEVHAD